MCSCSFLFLPDQPEYATDRNGLTMHEMAAYWRRQYASVIPPGINHFPLECPGVAFTSDMSRSDLSANWQNLLGGGNPAPALSLSKTQQDFKWDSITATRTWAIDGVLAHITTLAAHKGEFQMTYQSTPVQQLSSNVHIQGRSVELTKHLYLGCGALAGYEYKSYVLFPHMHCTSKSFAYLSHAQQKLWVDNIVLPSVRATCPTEVCVGHPRSFVDALASDLSDVDYSDLPTQALYDIPNFCLRSFWTEVCKRSSEFVSSKKYGAMFRDPFLIIRSKLHLHSGAHKVHLPAVRLEFEANLARRFHFDPKFFPHDE
jgi:hypothetical protein